MYLFVESIHLIRRFATSLRELIHLILYIIPIFAAMNINDFYREAPVLATILTLAYAAVMVMLVYMLVRMYRK